jgi:hypothetical protein
MPSVAVSELPLLPHEARLIHFRLGWHILVFGHDPFAIWVTIARIAVITPSWLAAAASTFVGGIQGFSAMIDNATAMMVSMALV